MDRSEIMHALGRPFEQKQISWRIGATNGEKTSGIALAYIDARDVMHRLDAIFGLDWQCRYTHADTKTICEIGVKIEGEWIWRAGGAGDSDIEAEKGAISDAFKRAAVLFRIGQYLYSLPNVWVDIAPAGKSYKIKGLPPALPKWATPAGYDEIMAKRKRQLPPEMDSTVKVAQAAYDAMSEESQQFLRDLVTDILSCESDEAMVNAYLKTKATLDSDENTAIWCLFDSKQRGIITRIEAERKKAV